ncbi:hypothetical protein ACF07V_10260 [Streptomyces sp. NPDC015661]|uniref:hypothetical protein n=1 Tax=Streptomyces sp. NPDC015661 TaxID=3364961 RepID=UPI0036F6CD83
MAFVAGVSQVGLVALVTRMTRTVGVSFMPCVARVALVFVVLVRFVLHGSAPDPLYGSCRLQENRIPL